MKITKEEKIILMKAFEILLSKFEETEEAEMKKKKQNETESEKLEYIITKYIREIGIPANLSGYSYIRTAIKLTVQNPEILNMITKWLYPEIAKKHQRTSSSIERSIRYSINVAFNRGNTEMLQKLFRGIPTNSEFIGLISDEIRRKL